MRKHIARALTYQAKRYLRKNTPKVVVITGSVGKTSTTQAIATILEQSFAIRKTLKNYNTDIGVPCSIFGREFPASLKNPFAWAVLFALNEFSLLSKDAASVLVLELGTDNPGEIAEFAWLNPDIAVVTSVAAEHMEQFKTLEAVAKEELTVASFSEKTILNKDMIDPSYLRFAQSEELFNYSRYELESIGLQPTDLQVVGEHSIDAITAGIAVAKELGMQVDAIVQGAKSVRPQPGRMQLLSGINNATLIDDTYNASPEAVIAALDYLYSVPRVQRIALLGNMNELGATSEAEHTKVGKHCDPGKLDLVITLGPDANKYTAVAAKEAGCAVAEAHTPYQAADIIKRQLNEGAYVLIKGSQNAVFAEEATKLLLRDPSDEHYLVRQSSFWAKKKEACFKDVS